MYEIITTKRERNERTAYHIWYLENQMKTKAEKGFKPVINKILDTIGL